MCWGRSVDASLTQRGVRLTSCGRDVDVNADLRDASSLQRSHAGVGAEISELEVYDVQVGGTGGDVRICLGDDHTLWAPQGTAIFQPAKRQLLWWCGLHLGYSTCYLCYIYLHGWWMTYVKGRIGDVGENCSIHFGVLVNWSNAVADS